MKVVAQTVYIETCLSAKIITTLPTTCIGPIIDAAVIAIALGMLLSAKSGMRYQGRTDLCLITMSEGTSVSGAFTKSLCPSAPVDWCKRIIDLGKARALLCNAGNANAFTGQPGEMVVEASAACVAEELNVTPQDVLLASTGVIGEPFEADEINRNIPDLFSNQQKSD